MTQNEQDRKVCEMLLSDNPSEIELGKTLCYSKHSMLSGLPACFILLICRSISSKYKKIVFELRVSPNSTLVWMVLLDSKWSVVENRDRNLEFNVADHIFKFVRQFQDVRKKKSLKSIDRWVTHQIPRLFSRMLPEILEGRSKEPVPITKVYINNVKL